MNRNTLPARKGMNWASAVTHCIRGHAYTPENTCFNGEGWRFCRTCYRESRERRRAEARA